MAALFIFHGKICAIDFDPGACANQHFVRDDETHVGTWQAGRLIVYLHSAKDVWVEAGSCAADFMVVLQEAPKMGVSTGCNIGSALLNPDGEQQTQTKKVPHFRGGTSWLLHAIQLAKFCQNGRSLGGSQLA